MALQVELLILRAIVSVAGILGNLVLLTAIFRLPRLKTFEIFLLGLASFNLEEILIVDAYDLVMLMYQRQISDWLCRTLKFFTILGEIGSIVFTVLISLYRYQKLRDAVQNINKAIIMDSAKMVYTFCCVSLLLVLLLAMPTYMTNLDGHMNNLTYNSTCPPDFFQCAVNNCPFFNKLYKYVFILLCNILPLLIVTWTSCLIVRVLVIQHRAVQVMQMQQQPKSFQLRTSRFRQSTVAILVAMAVFQVDWTLYLVLHLAFSPYTFSSWSEMEFFITTSYTTISPYVYGIGNNLLSWKALSCES